MRSSSGEERAGSYSREFGSGNAGKGQRRHRTSAVPSRERPVNRIMLPELLVLADDLTGALEGGAAFAQYGIPARVEWGREVECCTRVLVIDTETRHMPGPAAAEEVKRRMAQHPARMIYKKTDSTLRGNIREELTACAEVGPVLYVPSYPKLGRTVRKGHLHVDEVPLEQTAFAKDPLHPIVDGNISRMLGSGVNVTVCEMNTDEEIRTAAEEWRRRGGVAAGPTAMLHQLALAMSPGANPPFFPAIGKALVVMGSRNECSLRQLSAATNLFADGRWELLQAPQEFRGDALAFALRFGRVAAHRFLSGGFDTAIIAGGDTAFATLNALGCSGVEPRGEVLPGVPL